MTTQRIQFGRCSFVPPKDYDFQEAASTTGPCEAMQELENPKDPVCVTLTDTSIHEPSDETFPLNMVLVTLVNITDMKPLDYLNTKLEELKKHMDEFQIDFCKKDKVQGHPGACSQNSFMSNFKIYQIEIIWALDQELVTASMMVTPPKLQKAWGDLRAFVNTVQLEENEPKR